MKKVHSLMLLIYKTYLINIILALTLFTHNKKTKNKQDKDNFFKCFCQK